MSNTNNEDVTFIQFHQPSLKSGEYTLELTQQITVPNSANGTPAGSTTESYTANKTFYVAGERFNLKPALIHSQFPPPNNTGDNSNVLPHIIVNRSTLPWERDADANDNELPWLWLFVYNDTDIAAGNVTPPQAIAANSLFNFIDPKTQQAVASQPNASLPQLDTEPGEDLSAKLNTLKINAQWLQNNKIIPTNTALKLLSSVRENTTTTGATIGQEWAICVANRLAQPGSNNYVHLVSLENRFSNGSFDYTQGVDANGNISLVSLANWQFSCPNDLDYSNTPATIAKLTKNGISTAIIQDIQTLPQGKLYTSTTAITNALASVIKPANQSSYENNKPLILSSLEVQTQSFKGLLDHVSRGSLKGADVSVSTAATNTILQEYINRSAVALPHQLRYGGQTVSWFHGPLAAGQNTANASLNDLPVALPVSSSDQLLQFDTTLGMFDVSYAAAWELGRQLTLNNRDMAMSMYAWKRQHAWNLKQQEQSLLYGHLPFASSDIGAAANADHQNKLENWFKQLNLLYNIPINYLIPDSSLLPDESIRFFTVDNLWLEALFDGAFSIGRVTEADQNRDASLANTAKPQYPVISGFLLRSEAVSGWPAMEINASNAVLQNSAMPTQQQTLTILRKQTLAPNILLCLFEGSVQTLDIHLKPEAIHFGFDRPTGSQTHYRKELKQLTNGAMFKPELPVKMHWLAPTTTEQGRVVDIDTLNTDMVAKLKANGQDTTSFCSAQFALEMIQGVPYIRFQVATND